MLSLLSLPLAGRCAALAGPSLNDEFGQGVDYCKRGGGLDFLAQNEVA